MKNYTKRDLPVAEARQVLEAGPIVLVSSHYKDKTNIMTMGWHTVMEFTPSLLGCVIADSNYSFELIRQSKECAINVPAVDLANEVVGIGNSDGDEIDKFRKFELTPVKASKIKAPLIKECFANFECRLHDARLVKDYNFFIFKIVKAHVTTAPKFPKTMHFHGKGVFTIAGKTLDLHKKFTKWKD